MRIDSINRKTMPLLNRLGGGVMIFLLVVVSTVDAAETDKTRNILIVNSYHRGYFWTDGMVKGIITTLENTNINKGIFVEYMDTRRYSLDAIFPELRRLYRTKYGKMKFDLIITADNNALEFIRRCRSELFGDVPIVFCGIELTDKSIFDGLEPVTGVVENMGEESAVEAALKMHPTAEQLVIVNNKDLNPISNIEAFCDSFRNRKKVVFIELTEYTYEQFLGRIKTFGHESIVLLPTRFSDSGGREYTAEEINCIMQSCEGPIYTNNFLLMGAGPVGGCMNFAKHHGQIAAEMAIKILNGEQVNNIPIMYKGPKDFIFDYNQLRHFGVSASVFLPNSTILNEPKSFYYQYKRQVWFAASIFAILSLMILILSGNIIRRRRAEKKLLAHQAQLKSLTSELSLIEERERRHVAAELDSRICQSLVKALSMLEKLHRSEAAAHIGSSLGDVCGILGQTVEKSRLLTVDLGSPILYKSGFEAAVAELLTGQVRKHNIAAEFEDDKKPKPLDADVRGILFRMVRELLINTVKHARADKVKVSLFREDNHIKVSVEDNGKGFEPSKIGSVGRKTGGFGFFSIRERLEQLGGRLEIKSAPGCGCVAVITVPLKSENGIEETEK